MSGDDGFLSRWSRRKRGVEPATAVVPAPAEPIAVAQAPVVADEPPPRAPTEPPPTLEDAAALPAGADVSRFVARGVDEDVKRAAVKKLFADPHFNVMDGLDVYIDDYSRPDPIPLSMLKQLNQSRVLGLFADDDESRPAAVVAPAAANDALSAPPAQDAGAPAVPQVPDEDPDLQLQPDDPAGPGGAEGRARPDGV